ncbi:MULTISPECIES: helix-turn-helix domain-containing protein [unclassified Marinobacter]|uniref:helix-turn-helix domain-containing protein n=1 Tax=unclassified Marinobacter TaxID=83889 RepID=UPI0008DE1EAD|nr:MULTISPECIES: helix-turn-helix domain-containing protein [unclassified Marinobacter]MBQ0832121.1 helix-turn-helix domain-containing protein [Marinobacter sp.]OHY72849.1 transcriptional regulator [Marinobacter sp. AC-23]
MVTTERDNRLLNEIQETASDLRMTGLISKRRLKEYEALCQVDKTQLPPDDIRLIRLQTCMSQAVFAAILNVSVSTVQKWEAGEKKPAGASLKLLNLVKRKGIEILFL